MAEQNIWASNSPEPFDGPAETSEPSDGCARESGGSSGLARESELSDGSARESKSSGGPTRVSEHSCELAGVSGYPCELAGAPERSCKLTEAPKSKVDGGNDSGKYLLLIGGPMGVGKSAVCRELLERLQPGVYLDGDWCWNMRPFSVTEETKAMVLDNITAMLTRFLQCPELTYVIFGWVMHQQEILNTICSRIPCTGVSVKQISLTAKPDTLRRRLERDIGVGLRTPDVIGRSLDYLPLYEKLDTIKVPTDGLTVAEVADRIAAMTVARQI